LTKVLVPQPVTRGQGRRLIEEEKLRPSARPHEGAAHAAPLQHADEPSPAGPATRQQLACVRVMDDAAITGKKASLRRRNDITQRRNTILERHGSGPQQERRRAAE
jgi:hypothetical protein